MIFKALGKKFINCRVFLKFKYIFMKAIIIAAGPATRLRPLTENMPKCMLKINGKPKNYAICVPEKWITWSRRNI